MITIIKSRWNRDETLPGKYRVIDDGAEFYTRGQSLVFEARCAGCGVLTRVSTNDVQLVPRELRKRGWTMTGRTSGAMWYCRRHMLSGAK